MGTPSSTPKPKAKPAKAAPASPPSPSSPAPLFALVLQGGGALGAYQGGVYEALARAGHLPDWVTGISIGAINAALIAGNPPECRVERLHEFWDLVSGQPGAPAALLQIEPSLYHQLGATLAASLGVSGFYRPRLPPPFLQPSGTPAAISFYDTAPLRATLERLIDFDLINSGITRLSVGAVNVRTGNSVCFDNTERRIGPEHIMASGALPPAFAPVMIDGEAYWDGGVVSNTPIQYVLDQRDAAPLVVAQVDLFSARGELPSTMGQALSRQKDITYSSRTRFNTDQATQLQRTRRDLLKLLDKLPPELRNDPEVQRLEATHRLPDINIVHLIYRQQAGELESKDYEFSRATMHRHWAAGLHDMHCSLEHPQWLKRSQPTEGVAVFDLTREAH